MLDTTVILAGAGGFVAGFISCWFFNVLRHQREEIQKRKADDRQRQQMQAQVQRLAPQDPNEVFDCYIARVDVERSAFVSVEYHLNDLIRDVREQKELTHLLRVVATGFSVAEPHLPEEPIFRDYILELHRRLPYLAGFLERSNIIKYLKWILDARRISGMAPADPAEPPIASLEQEILAAISQVLANFFPDDPDTLANMLERMTQRIEPVCDQLEAEWRALHAPPEPEVAAVEPGSRKKH